MNMKPEEIALNDPHRRFEQFLLFELSRVSRKKLFIIPYDNLNSKYI